MIDMHCHLIYEVDDGSKSLEQTIRMAKKAYSLGYEGICATPHFISNSHETDVSELCEKLTIINDILKKDGINMIIYPGNEVYFSMDIVENIKSKKICTLNSSKYFLMEFPMTGLVLNMEQIIFMARQEGYIPIIAHPERYEFVTKDISKLLPLIEAGAFLQLNVGSIMGLYGSNAKKNAVKLLKNNMISFIGTDAHDSKRVYDIFDKSLKKISKLVDSETLDIILNKNPRKVLNNEEIFTWEPKIKK